MYSIQDRQKALDLYIKYDYCAAKTIKVLGYPHRKILARWYKEYLQFGSLHVSYRKTPRYSDDQKNAAINYYFERGQNISKTLRALGYPSKGTFKLWLSEKVHSEHKPRLLNSNMIQSSQEQRKEAVIELCVRESSAETVAVKHGTSRQSLYKWRKQLLGEEKTKTMTKSTKRVLPNDKDKLISEIELLKKQIYKQQMELDILNEAAEIIKKDQGIDLRKLSNKEKANLIDALRMKYPLNSLLNITKIPKSSYFYHRECQKKPDKYSSIRLEVKRVFSENQHRYGYRRVHSELKSSGNIVSEKVIRRIMSEEHLNVPGKKKRRYSSYLGEISPAVDNIVNRDFHSDKPNRKWLTDLTEFHIPAGKVYLSPIIDCFDGLAVSWTIGTSPDATLVNDMLDTAIHKLKVGEQPILHTDRGSHYRWPGWIMRMDEAGLVRSMSKKGCTPDNSACEGFFGRVKNEMFHYRSWKDVSIDKFILELDSYLRWYNEKRIKMSLGGLSPISYRKKLGLEV